jgi:hypothetical protein
MILSTAVNTRSVHGAIPRFQQGFLRCSLDLVAIPSVLFPDDLLSFPNLSLTLSAFHFFPSACLVVYVKLDNHFNLQLRWFHWQ